MPILSIHAAVASTAEQNTLLLQKACEAVHTALDAPLPSIRIFLNTVAADNVIVAGEIGKPTVVCTANLIVGRAEEKKAALIAALNKTIANVLNISDQDIRVIIYDIPKTDMGVAGGISAKAAGK